MTIKNMPEYALDYQYIVYHTVDGVKWFYGAYATHEKAVDVAFQIGGRVYCRY